MGRVLTWIVRSVRRAGWAPLSVFLLHAALVAAGVYRPHPSIDIPLHFAGGVVIAYFFDRSLAFAVEAGFLGAPNRVALAVMVLGCTCAAAVHWEFAEWTYDQFRTPGDARGYLDTLFDMALGVLGGAVFVAWSARRAVATRPHDLPCGTP